MNPEPIEKTVIGWREWLSLPTLGIEQIKAKVDTGARTSALHTFDLEVYRDGDGLERVRFKVHPLQRNLDLVIECDHEILESRTVRDSGGHEEARPFIRIPVHLGGVSWEAEVSLTNRDNMKFRMLLGRSAMADRFLVDPKLSYQLGKRPASLSRSLKTSSP